MEIDTESLADQYVDTYFRRAAGWTEKQRSLIVAGFMAGCTEIICQQGELIIQANLAKQAELKKSSAETKLKTQAMLAEFDEKTKNWAS